jgi:hypothetical protein
MTGKIAMLTINLLKPLRRLLLVMKLMALVKRKKSTP